jgi:hypothetical protein
MQENKQKWMELCEQAADEQDPKKLAALILQINFVLEAKELRLGRYHSTCRRELADVGRIALRPLHGTGGKPAMLHEPSQAWSPDSITKIENPRDRNS